VKPTVTEAGIGFPRFFRLGRYSINSYKFFLCVGIYIGTLAAAGLASSSGLSPLRMGLAATACALVGLIGARLYFMLVNASHFFRGGALSNLWDSSQGGWSLFGSLITFVPFSIGAAAWLHLPVHVLCDYLAFGVLAGGFWIRLGCVFNGCCAGRDTSAPWGVHLHDTKGVIKSRIPVQFLEMAWWLIGLIGFLMLWPHALLPGNYALAVVAWYGSGRFLLEPLREKPDIVLGWLPIDQAVAALLAAGAVSAMIIRSYLG
jgi:prolipoprotein diacylglyceryltransferase